MPKGLFAGRKLKLNRKKHHPVNRVHYNAKARGHPRLRGLVVAKIKEGQKQPSSGVLKGVKVRLAKSGKTVLAYIPGDRGDKFVPEFAEVIIEGINGSLGRAKGTIPKFGFRVVMVNKMSLEQLCLGRKLLSNV